MTPFQTLRQRNLVHNHTDATSLEKAIESGATFYCGFDPTADSLHVGSLLPLIVMQTLAQAGCKPIGIVGGATALIGDPSGRKSERPLLTVEQVNANAHALTQQIQKIVPNCTIINNLQWHQSKNMLNFLRDTGKYISVNKLMALDSVQSRLEGGISFTEFTYSLMQAEDFAQLNEEYNCTLQIGGSDQWGNMSIGTELIRKRLNKEAHLFTFPLLVQANGEKFGKSVAGAIWLDAKKTSPQDFNNYFHQTADTDIVHLLKMLTQVPLAEIEEVTKNAPTMRIGQKLLAKEMMKLVHPEINLDGFDRAKFKYLTKEKLLELPIKEYAVELATQPKLLEVLIKTGLSSSRNQARRDVENKSIYLNGQMIQDVHKEITKEDLLHATALLLSKGKLQTVRVLSLA